MITRSLDTDRRVLVDRVWREPHLGDQLEMWSREARMEKSSKEAVEKASSKMDGGG
jgi:hypothetical protein